MRLKTIEYENFRNFKNHGKIIFSTDGKVTIIYGKNGDGKTTLHQLFQWIFYGRVNFNRTATENLYNWEYESERTFGEVFEVFGRIDFEHDAVQYSLTRRYEYKKGSISSEKIREELSLQRMDDDYNWKIIDNPQETIEKLLPSGLSDYFFFDGESMIADLRVKGKDSATKLRKALYSMFDLDILEMAVSHIGRTDLKTSALGKLYLSKGTIASGTQITAVKTNIENAQNKISSNKQTIQDLKEEKSRLKDLSEQISEKIGSSKSKAEYENQRNNLKNQRDTFLNNEKNDYAQFGDQVMDMFPSLLVSKAVKDAKGKINLKINKSELPAGVNKRLIAYLLSSKTCICGNPICDEEREHINSFLSLLPPRSYASLYHDFTRTATQMGKGYDREIIEEIIKRALKNNEQAQLCDINIKKLDDVEKDSPDIEDLVVSRQKAENRIEEIDKSVTDFEKETDKYEIYLKKQMKEFNTLTDSNDHGKAVEKKIAILNEVVEYFANRLDEASDDYSRRLQDNIQLLLNEMLTSKRSVSVTKEFSVRVIDSYNDESKSEGQFAVVSFAYIGGILKMLREEQNLSVKDYPLVLDGPFSKLDVDQRQNVVDALPSFAPQVIVFSKDDLHDVFSKENIGKVWTIKSNEEKNVAEVVEGKLWK